MGKTTGNDSGQGGTAKATGKVVALRGQLQRIEPPDGWLVGSPYGHLRCDNTPAGRLVRLADVVRWLIGSPKELPRSAAVEAVCNALTPEVYGHLYQLKNGGYAEPVAADSMWWFQTDAAHHQGIEKKAQDQRQKQFEADRKGDWHSEFTNTRPSYAAMAGRAASHKPAGTNYIAPAPGLAALIARIKANWTQPPRKPELDPLIHKREWLAGLAIQLDTAHALWGYGLAKYTMTFPASGQAPASVTWIERSNYGVHRADATPGGRLVRLADLLRWLMTTYQLPRADALGHVIDRFDLNHSDWLYRLSAGGYAEPERATSGFLKLIRLDGFTADQADAMPAEEKAIRQAVERLRFCWGDANQADSVLGSPSSNECERFAVTLELAGEWFGYSVVGESEAPAAGMEGENPADTDEWTGERLAAEMKALRLAGVKAYTQALVKKSGIKEREIRRRIAELPAASMPKNSVFDNAKKAAVRR